MMRALYSSVSGLKTHQTKMDVIGNNIANVNTVGFKSSRTTFSTMMSQTMSFASGASAATGKGGVNAKQIGLGTNFASTAVDIDTGGASESTGKAFDLKLSDTNSTSFYIVNTGTENVFTRAGAFYVDGAGNLCMESTGYTVMGWQVDANGNIVKDTVTPLRIMSPENQTSQPEYTTDARCTGILDDNNANVNSDRGYTMSLSFFDNLGYSYNARFAVQKTGGDGEFTINLTDILDSNGKSILGGKADIRLGDLFGTGTTNAQGSCVDITDSYTLSSGMSNALKGLEMPADQETITYSYPSEFVNEYLKKNLPEGLTVKFTAPNTNFLGQPSNPVPDTQISIWSGNVEVTDTYRDFIDTAIPTGAVVSTGTPASGETMVNVVTPSSMVSEWDSKNLIPSETITVTNQDGTTTNQVVKMLNASQLEQLVATFQLQGTGADGTTPTQLDLTGVQVYVSATLDANNNTIYSFTGTGSSPNTLSFMNALMQTNNYTIDTAVEPTIQKANTLWDYVNQAYVTSANATEINGMGIFTTGLPTDAELRYNVGDGSYTIVTPSSDGFKMQFSTADGSLQYIGQEGSTSQTLRMSMYQLEGDNPNPFSDIQIDFSTLKNLANGATNTAALSSGDADSEGKGKRVGVMTGLQVDNAGKIYGSYSNGNTVLLGQIAVARFANASGLESIGDNCYRTTMNSGEFDGIGVEMDSDGSSIDSGTLEMSNVDLATEFTQMITTQRGYQANSRVISTSDSILEELVNLKR